MNIAEVKTDGLERLYLETAESEHIEMYLKAMWRILEKGEEIILGGDFNTGVKRVTSFHTWLTDLGLVDVREGEAEGTFVQGGGAHEAHG